MMKVVKYPCTIERPGVDNSSDEKIVRKILKDVKRQGDKAVKRYNKMFAGAKSSDPVITDELKAAILHAKKNIEKFHLSQIEKINKVETAPGVTCWRESRPIESVGLYIPGGTAPLLSTVLMLAVPAQLAGCKEIILCTPNLHPAILYAADLCGIKTIIKAGGAQAIAAMAYGTVTIPKVQKIFGPGNQFVTLAKQFVQQEGIAIDMPAGPSELLVIADETAIPAYVAADLLSQAEHGPDSQVILFTTSPDLSKQVKKEIKKQLRQLPRKSVANASLKKSKIVLGKSLDEGIAFSNAYAPEHLILTCANAEQIASQVANAGSVFIGNFSPESAGDYASGTNHTLPTNGYAAMYSGVSVDSFTKKITFQQLSKEGLRQLSGTIMTMAEAEGLEAHKNAVAIRL
jgi:histidinol dehydrogenase